MEKEDTRNTGAKQGRPSPQITISTEDGDIVLVPGPVYCFYYQSHFNVHEYAPSFKGFRRKIKHALINNVVITGKPLVDPYYLNWRYTCRIKYDHIMKRFRARSLKAQETKAMTDLLRHHQVILSKLQKMISENDYGKAVERAEKTYGLKGGRAGNGNRLQERLDSLAQQQAAMDQRLAQAKKQFFATKDAQGQEFLRLKGDWDRKCADQERKNEPYLSIFSTQEQREYRYFQTPDLKRLYWAKTRELDTRDSWKDFFFQMRSPLVRLVTPWNRSLAKAMRRNKRWLRKGPSIDLIPGHFKKTFAAINNFKVGLLGQFKQALVDPNKTIGHNLVKILMITNECSEKEAHSRALTLLRDLDVYEPEDIMNRYIWQFINDDYHYKILFAYLLAYSPEVVLVDRSALHTKHVLTTELYSLILALQPKYGYIFVIFDDTMFDKDFPDMRVYTVTKDNRILPYEKLRK